MDTLTLLSKNLNQRSLTPRWPLTPCLLRSHVWLYPRIIVSTSHGNTSMYVDTVINVTKYHIHTHTMYYIHTTYRMSDHIVSYWTQFRRDKNKPGKALPRTNVNHLSIIAPSNKHVDCKIGYTTISTMLFACLSWKVHPPTAVTLYSPSDYWLTWLIKIPPIMWQICQNLLTKKVEVWLLFCKSTNMHSSIIRPSRTFMVLVRPCTLIQQQPYILHPFTTKSYFSQ